MIPLPKKVRSQFAEHDMLEGPCCCGAWHTLGDWSFEFKGRKFVDLDSAFTEQIIMVGGSGESFNETQKGTEEA